MKSVESRDKHIFFYHDVDEKSRNIVGDKEEKEKQFFVQYFKKQQADQKNFFCNLYDSLKKCQRES